MTARPPRTRRLALALTATALAAVGCSYTSREALPPTPASAQSSTIYASDGTLIHTFHAEENRRDVALEDVPTTLRDAVVAIEDERFYRHNGVDLRAVMRAVRENADAGEVSEGGSTITQQYVKQVLLRDSSRTVERKLQEASLALQLERHYSKDKILELYLNAVYFGNGAYGVAAAADQYFRKPVSELGLAESALLAGLIQRPSATDPYDAPEAATARRNVVLDRMVREHYATRADADAAKASPLSLGSSTTPAAERYRAAYFVEEVKQWILHDPRFGATAQDRRTLLFGGGLKIRTTVDLEAQAAAEAAANAILPDPEGPDVALVSLVPDTGEVRAMVGGRDFFGAGEAAKLNLAMAPRQAGSSFKPLVLAAALEDGIPATKTYAAPGCLLLPSYDPKKPVCNYSDGEAYASADLTEGTVHSVNTLYAQLMGDVGPKDAVEVARALGIRSNLEPPVPSMVLGSKEVTAVDMATAYGTIANRGMQVDPVLVTRITRADGTVLYRHEHDEEKAIDADVADTVTAILQQVVQRGTGTAAGLGRPVAGKTGTADDWHDAWFVGYTPDLVTSVWVGFHEGQISMKPPLTSIRVTGGSYPARIWHDYMSAAVAGTPVHSFHAPPAGTFSTPSTVPGDLVVPGPGETTTTAPGMPGSPTTVTPRPRGERGTTRVPDVVGQDQGAAVTTLRAAGFKVVKRSVTTDAPQGTVTLQNPAAGSLAADGSTVYITVAK